MAKKQRLAFCVQCLSRMFVKPLLNDLNNIKNLGAKPSFILQINMTPMNYIIFAHYVMSVNCRNFTIKINLLNIFGFIQNFITTSIFYNLVCSTI